MKKKILSALALSTLCLGLAAVQPSPAGSAGVGLLSGGGIEGAAKGAIYAGAAGAVVGKEKDKERRDQ